MKKNGNSFCIFWNQRYIKLMKTLLVVNVLFYDAFYQKGGMTQKEICRRTLQSKQTVNLIIKNLLAENYVTVTEVPDNKRNKIVQMTDAGRAYCEKVVRHITWAEDTAMSMFTPEEQKLLIDLSRKFTKNLAMLVNQEGEDR